MHVFRRELQKVATLESSVFEWRRDPREPLPPSHFSVGLLRHTGVPPPRPNPMAATGSAPETYFSHEERMFPDLDDGRIPTEQFIRACQGIADFVGFLGTAFGPVKSDISGNVTRVKAKFESNKALMPFLQDLINLDLKETGGKLGDATEALLWLKRGLEFMLELLSQMVAEYRANADHSKTESLGHIVSAAYDKSLKRHHNFVSKQIFKMVKYAVPYRRTVLKAVALGKDGLEDVCIHHIETHLDNFRLNVHTLVEFYIAKGLETRA
ncbi:hypothetical protein QR680_013332 [Steinernema hermaphroditum]|uniref:Glycolipid transfer protein domain-containing protein n=1 Tax=Steinernema hermaphroditum TaxID=289476 RepID=A0AA39M254_9BILA|nr:hypothetical protein QR680_013332 [Steinernema hermaphroditum]